MKTMKTLTAGLRSFLGSVTSPCRVFATAALVTCIGLAAQAAESYAQIGTTQYEQMADAIGAVTKTPVDITIVGSGNLGTKETASGEGTEFTVPGVYNISGTGWANLGYLQLNPSKETSETRYVLNVKNSNLVITKPQLRGSSDLNVENSHVDFAIQAGASRGYLFAFKDSAVSIKNSVFGYAVSQGNSSAVKAGEISSGGTQGCVNMYIAGTFASEASTIFTFTTDSSNNAFAIYNRGLATFKDSVLYSGYVIIGDVENRSDRWTVGRDNEIATLELDNSKVIKNNSDAYTLTVGDDVAGQLVMKNGSSIDFTDVDAKVNSNGTITMDAASQIKCRAFTNAGTILVDMTGATATRCVLVDASATSDYGTYEFVQGKANGYALRVENNDLVALKEIATLTDGTTSQTFVYLSEAVAAWNKAADGAYTITVKAGAYAEGDLCIFSKPNRSLVIKPESGTVTLSNKGTKNGIVFMVSGSSSTAACGNVTIEGFNFDLSGTSTTDGIGAAVYFAAGGSGTSDPYYGDVTAYSDKGSHRYAHNVTIKNCSCVGNKTENTYLANSGTNSQPYDITIDGGTITDMGYVASGYFVSTGDPAITLSGLTVTNTKVLLNNMSDSGNVVVKDCPNISTYHDYVIRTYCNLAVSNCVFNNTNAGTEAGGILVFRSKSAATVTISNCTFNTQSDNIYDVFKDKNEGVVTAVRNGVTLGSVTKAGDHFDFFEPYVQIISSTGAVTPRATVAEAIAAVKDGETVALSADVKLTEKLVIANGKTFTLDLGGKTLTGRVNVSGAQLTVTNGTIDAGTMSQALNLYGTEDKTYIDKIFTYVKVEKDVTLRGSYGLCFLPRLTNGYFPLSYGVKADFYGKSLCVSPVYVGGNIGNDQNDYGDCSAYQPEGIASRSKAMALYGPELNVYGMLTCTGSADENPQGITLSGMIRVNVYEGASITGGEGVGMKSGVLNVYGGTITSTGAKQVPVSAVSSGCEASGAAISLTSYYNNKNYEDRAAMTVNIQGGTIIGTHNAAVLVAHSYANSVATPFAQGAAISITGGTFKSGDDQQVIYVAEKVAGDDDQYPAKFVQGGTFYSAVAESCLAAGYSALAQGTDPETWKVALYVDSGDAEANAAIVDVKESESTADTANVEQEVATALAANVTVGGETKTVSEFISQKTTVSGVKLTLTNTVETVGSAQFEQPAGVQAVVDAAKAEAAETKEDALATESERAAAAKFATDVVGATNIEIKVSVTVTPTAYSNTDTPANNRVAFALEPVATVSVKDDKGTVTASQVVPVSNEMIDKNQKIAVSIFTGFEPGEIQHLDDDGYLIEKFASGQIAYDAATGVATVQIDHFSTLQALGSATPNYVAKIGDTGFETLSDALEYIEEKCEDGTANVEICTDIDEDTTKKGWNFDCDVAFVAGHAVTVKFDGLQNKSNKIVAGRGYDIAFGANVTFNAQDFAIEADTLGFEGPMTCKSVVTSVELDIFSTASVTCESMSVEKDAVLYISAGKLVTTDSFKNEGTVKLDVAAATDKSIKVIEYTGSDAKTLEYYGTLQFVNNTDDNAYFAKIKDNNDLCIVRRAAMIGSNEYETLAEAFAAVQNGQTIELCMDNSETIATAPTATSFTFNSNGHSLAGGSVASAQGYTFFKSGNVCTYGLALAQVGTTKYIDLATALNAAKSQGSVCELLCDVTLTGSWTPISDFQGTFDGKGFTISGLNVNVQTGNAGLFGSASEGVIKNVTLDHPTVVGTGANVAALVGAGFRETVSNVTVTAATVTGGAYVGGLVGGAYTSVYDSQVLNSTITGVDQVGGVIGYICGASVTGCTVTNNTIKAQQERAGGLVGKLQIGDSGRQYFNNNVISGTATAPDYAGGVAAQIMGGDGDYEIHYNDIDVTLSANVTSPIGVLRTGQSTDFTGVIAANCAANWWTDQTLNANVYTYTAAETGTTAQNVYRGIAGIENANGVPTATYKTLAEAIEVVQDDQIVAVYGDNAETITVAPTATKFTFKSNGHDLSKGSVASAAGYKFVYDAQTGVCTYRRVEDRLLVDYAWNETAAGTVVSEDGHVFGRDAFSVLTGFDQSLWNGKTILVKGTGGGSRLADDELTLNGGVYGLTTGGIESTFNINGIKVGKTSAATLYFTNVVGNAYKIAAKSKGTVLVADSTIKFITQNSDDGRSYVYAEDGGKLTISNLTQVVRDEANNSWGNIALTSNNSGSDVKVFNSNLHIWDLSGVTGGATMSITNSSLAATGFALSGNGASLNLVDSVWTKSAEPSNSGSFFTVGEGTTFNLNDSTFEVQTLTNSGTVNVVGTNEISATTFSGELNVGSTEKATLLTTKGLKTSGGVKVSDGSTLTLKGNGFEFGGLFADSVETCNVGTHLGYTLNLAEADLFKTYGFYVNSGSTLNVTNVKDISMMYFNVYGGTVNVTGSDKETYLASAMENFNVTGTMNVRQSAAVAGILNVWAGDTGQQGGTFTATDASVKALFVTVGSTIRPSKYYATGADASATMVLTNSTLLVNNINGGSASTFTIGGETTVGTLTLVNSTVDYNRVTQPACAANLIVGTKGAIKMDVASSIAATSFSNRGSVTVDAANATAVSYTLISCTQTMANTAAFGTVNVLNAPDYHLEVANNALLLVRNAAWVIHSNSDDTATTNRYVTLKAALEAVQNGETIVVLKDNTEAITTTITATDFTFDSNHCDLTGGTVTVADTYMFRKNADGTCTYGKIVAKIDTANYITLADAVAAVTEGSTVTLTSDCSVTATLATDKSFTLDTVTFTVTGKGVRVFQVKAGTLTLASEGTITNDGALGISSSVIRVGDNALTGAAGLVVGSGVKVTTATSYAITAFGATTETVDVSGTVTSTVTPNEFYDGCAISTVGTDATPATVTIRDGAKVSATSNAIYMPAGNLVVAGGAITGAAAVYQKAGSLAISGGTFTATAAKADYAYNGNGGIPTGNAIVLDNCSYPSQFGTVSITGGTFTGYGTDDIGTYCGNGQTTCVGKVISGGTYAHQPAQTLCVDWYAPYADGDVWKIKVQNVFITDLKGATRYPWNGKVDITFNLQTLGAVKLFVAAYDANGNRLTMAPEKTSLVKPTATESVDVWSGVPVEATGTTPVAYHFVWDSAGVVSGTRLEGVRFKVFVK